MCTGACFKTQARNLNMSLPLAYIRENLVPSNYLKIAQEAQKCKNSAIKELFAKRKLPESGWSDELIEHLVHQLSSLDSNNFVHNMGLGEREARIACKLVARRHYNFGHGIGRSVDLLEPQPKAAGSSCLANLTNTLLDLLHTVGLRNCEGCFLVPLATGMTLTLCMLSLKKSRPNAKYVIWSRIDQKSCIKSITATGLIPIVVPMQDVHSMFVTNMEEFEHHIKKLKTEEILCLSTTTSCFAPRCCDNVIEVAKLAAKYNLPHLVNNAYGVQSTFLTHQLKQAQRLGRVDLFVQSTDKNLLVPVGGAIAAYSSKTVLQSVATTYAGRASSSQTLDVFMTLLSLGKNGYHTLLKERKENFIYLREHLKKFASLHNEMVFETKNNPISLALTLSTLDRCCTRSLTEFGSMLYTRGVSGVCVVKLNKTKQIDGIAFTNWGTHSNECKMPYLTVAAALGIKRSEIDVFFVKLEACWQAFINQN